MTRRALGIADDNRRYRVAPEAETAKFPAGVERLINNHGGWQGISFPVSVVERVEARDRQAMLDAAVRKAQGEKPTCPRMRHEYIPSRSADKANAAIRVKAEVQDTDGMWVNGGYIEAWPKLGHYVVSSAEVPLHLLATCPGLGTKLYETLARVACKNGKTIAGSDMRSPFSERFWRRQMSKGRAECGAGRGEVYDTPIWALGEELRAGTITVPQFNDLVRGLPAQPEGGRYWNCSRIPLKSCDTDFSLRGVKRFRIESR